ncbi:MAG: efflux RND transporter periplasmic adaptor subunit [Deltaproteobacteria bacterium]|nr:efflux RND transporter periplasmic adaptor subunit [Deltaproteobacteria bacterium]
MRPLLFAVVVIACGDRDVRPPVVRDAGLVIDKKPVVDAPAPGFIGVIAAAESVDIAPRFQGVIAAIRVRPGDKVTVGQIIAEMDQKSMLEELRAAEAALGAAAAAKRQAEVDVEDAKRKALLESEAAAKGISSQSVADEAKLAVKRTEAAAQRAGSLVAAETSHVQTARDHLTDNVLKAKFDGTVAMRFRDPGSTVAPGTAIVRIVGRGGPRLRFAVPPERARALTLGTKVTASVETIPTPITAIVQQVSPALDPASGMIMIEAEIETPGADLRPGLAATVRPS